MNKTGTGGTEGRSKIALPCRPLSLPSPSGQACKAAAERFSLLCCRSPDTGAAAKSRRRTGFRCPPAK
ncbi:hypothetical protein DPQ22_03850 [Candidatus Tokpelaia sp.]|nr:hypothetical protein DPQ22_03850 [Candidatus Tokpelaia sp.]